MNALTHGAYATTHLGVTIGPMPESPHEIDEFVAKVVDALEPRDALEALAAREVALVYYRRLRVERYEAAAISAAATPGIEERRLGLDKIKVLARARRQLSGLLDWLKGADPADLTTPKAMLSGIAAALGDDEVKRFNGDPDEPLHGIGYYAVLDRWLELDHGGDKQAAAAWVVRVLKAIDRDIGPLEDLAEGLVADRIFDGAMKKSVDLLTRVDRLEEKALQRYMTLRNRDLATSDSNVGKE